MFTWVGSSTAEEQIAGWLLIILLVGWIVSIISMILGFVTRRSGGGWFIASGALFLAIWLFCYFSTPMFNPYPTIYNFIDASLDGSGWLFPFEAILYRVGAIIIWIGRVPGE